MAWTVWTAWTARIFIGPVEFFRTPDTGDEGEDELIGMLVSRHLPRVIDVLPVQVVVVEILEVREVRLRLTG